VIPGHEVSGIVTALGYGTTGVAVGDAVYGLTDWACAPGKSCQHGACQ
jgi:D-arabinose 1-dehydrogenase-like Zn-dependent alcohol dehydrogenase